jgi:putative ABC transport system permease protein
LRIAIWGTRVADPAKWYRLLLKLYPARFREEFAGPLEREFRDEYRESGGGFWFWAGALADAAVSIPGEFTREMLQDLHFSVRVYAQRPLVTILAVAALAMAIGATTGVFSIVNALLLRSLPFRDPERIVRWSQFYFIRDGYPAWRANQTYADAVAPYYTAEMNLTRDADAVRVKVTESTAEFFRVMGSEPEIGRAFADGEDLPGHVNEAVISYSLWQQFFGGDGRVLGSTVKINGIAMKVIGVARPKFDYPDRTAVWTPSVVDMGALPKTGAIFWHGMARLKARTTIERATSMIQASAPRGNEAPRFISLRETLSGNVTQASLVMMGAAAFVLLIACANIANLLLARVAERRSEIAVRAALGASRARLVQQLITESIALAAMSSIAGVFIAQWVSKIALAAQPVPLGSQEYTILDWRVLEFAVGITALTGILFGVFPAWLSGRVHSTAGVSDRSGGSTSGASRLRNAMVAVQVSLTLVLLAGSIVMGRGFLRLMGTDLGFHADRLVTMSISLLGSHHNTAVLRGNYLNESLERLRAVPGVESAAAIDSLPLTGDYFTPTGVIAETEVKLDSGATAAFATYSWATADYFKTMATPILSGREFTHSDGAGTEPVAVVSDMFARSTGLGNAIIGRKFTSQFYKVSYTIVGVVSDIRHLVESDVRPMVYLAATQSMPRTFTFAARVHGNPENYLAVCRDAVQLVDHEVAVYGASTLGDRLAATLARPRLYTTAILFLSGFAVLLAIIGIYGVSSYSVTQRKHEIGVRMAVGATVGNVRWMILRQGLVPTVAGVVIGIGGAAAAGRFLEHLITDAKSMDAATCGAAASGLAITAALSMWSATRRVTRMDPIETLRSE